jgi:tRNA(Ile)-lysidine synthase
VTRRPAPAAGASAAQRGFSSMALARRLRVLADPLNGARLCVAFSGGADSTALLAAAAALRGRYRCRVRALHVNHHLQPGAAGMARAARAGARALGVPCRVIDAPVRVARGASPEAAAREVRYAALQAALRPGEWLLLAQHQDDQVEALLLQLLRGAGVAGLAAMPARAGCMLRPLLAFQRAQLLGYLRRRRIAWTDDPSNVDERFGRNYLRLRVLPLLRARWPGLGTALSRSAALAAEADTLLAARAEAQLGEAHVGPALSVPVLRRLSAPDRHNALRHWLESRQLPMPDQSRLQEIAGPMLRARDDAQPQVRWRGGLVRRHGGLLHALAEPVEAGPLDTPAPAPAMAQWHWLRQPRLALPGGAALELCPDPQGRLSRAALPARVTVAFRGGAGAEAARAGGRRLKRRLKAAATRPWQRGAVPLVYDGARLLAVGDSWQAPELTVQAAADGAPRCRLRWHRAAASFI